jgi:superfamily II DNA or RNA helicase
LVIIDEAHNNASDTAKRIIGDHREKGAYVVGYTATPLGLADIYSKLVVAGRNSELRACGALVPCNTYGPDEPDTKHIKKLPSGEYSENEVRKVFRIQQVFGRIFYWWKKLNPDARPTILFAPGVKESTWCAQQFESLGVRAAHIDGEDIYLDGKAYKSDKRARDELLEQIRDGSVKVVCNRFVLREGIDLPELYHGILATVFGGVQSYIQSGGRLLRAHPSLDHVIIQDHGGNWHRHGSLNADREWELSYTNNVITGLREQAMREKREPEPIVCPHCGRVRSAGKQCPQCEYESPKKTRIIMQTDGTLREMEGDIYRPRRVRTYLGIADDWKRMYHRGQSRCKNGENCTFVALEALFARENHWNYPPRDLPLMPIYPADWFRPISEVPKERLL